MGRYYRLSKKITDAQLEEITKEVAELPDVDTIEFSKDCSCMKVVTKDEQFADVMGNAVNICSRVANGLEISFTGFAFDESIQE